MKRPKNPKQHEWPSTVILDFSRDGANASLRHARHGDYRLLAKRLREGHPISAQMQIAADIIEGKITKKRGRQGDPDGLERALDIQRFVNNLISDENYPKDAAVKAAETKFTLSKARVYEALKRVALAQEIHDEIVRQAQIDMDDFG